jgi:hypothetical protein
LACAEITASSHDPRLPLSEFSEEGKKRVIIGQLLTCGFRFGVAGIERCGESQLNDTGYLAAVDSSKSALANQMGKRKNKKPGDRR